MTKRVHAHVRAHDPVARRDQVGAGECVGVVEAEDVADLVRHGGLVRARVMLGTVSAKARVSRVRVKVRARVRVRLISWWPQNRSSPSTAGRRESRRLGRSTARRARASPTPPTSAPGSRVAGRTCVARARRVFVSGVRVVCARHVRRVCMMYVRGVCMVCSRVCHVPMSTPSLAGGGHVVHLAHRVVGV